MKIFPSYKSKNESRIMTTKQQSGVSQCKIPFFECEFLHWMKNNQPEQSYNLWFAAASNMAVFGEEGREAYHQLSRNYPNYALKETNDKFNELLNSHERGIGPVRCDTIENYGFRCSRKDCFANSPATLVKKLKEKEDLKELGFSLYEKGKKAGQIRKLNTNQLVRYFNESEFPTLFHNEQYYIYQDGFWQGIEENVLLAEIRNVINNAKKDVWEPKYERQYKITLKRDSAFSGQLDCYREHLNLPDGMLDLNTFQIKEHDLEYYSTVRVDIPYKEDADCPRFKQFLEEVMEEDQERINILQEWFGYCLTPDAGSCQRIMLLHGKGANGKSVALEILSALVGEDNVSNITLSKIEKRFGRANLIGKTVNISTENEMNGEKLKTEYIKAISSGDSIDIEIKHQDSFSYDPMVKLIFALNSLPNYVPDRTYALYRRLVIIPFNRTFSEEEADKQLAEKIINNELPGILQWALKGLKRLRENNYVLSHSQVVEDKLEKFKENQNPIYTFFKKEVEVDENSEVSRKELKESFYGWARRNNHSNLSSLSSRKFWDRMGDVLAESGMKLDDIEKKINGRRYLSGLKISENNIGEKDEIEKIIEGI